MGCERGGGFTALSMSLMSTRNRMIASAANRLNPAREAMIAIANIHPIILCTAYLVSPGLVR